MENKKKCAHGQDVTQHTQGPLSGPQYPVDQKTDDCSNFNIQKVEQGDQKEAETENHPPLPSELEASLGYKRQCLKKKIGKERERVLLTPCLYESTI